MSPVLIILGMHNNIIILYANNTFGADDINEIPARIRDKSETIDTFIDNVEVAVDTGITDEVGGEIVEKINGVTAETNNLSQPKQSNLQVVHAEAVFQNSPFLNLLQDDLLSLEKFILSEKHLQNNIAKIDFQVITNTLVAVKIHVKTSNLWENARPYIWKHLGGENYWTRGNGTKVQLVKIHVK